MIEFIKPDWPAPAHVHAATTLRAGGFSKAAYSSLNLADHVGDTPEIVAKNRELLYVALDFQTKPLWLQQVHGIDVVHWEETAVQTLEADAIFTHQKYHPCAVLTADCLPILLCDCAGSVVAAVHAGWKGLLKGVIEATVDAMQVPSESLLAWMGPAIGPEAFIVGDEVRNAFMAHNKNAEKAFTPQNSQKWFADIFLLGKQRLNSLGVTEIYGGGLCTYSDPSQFFSFRRDPSTGRMASLIWMA
jgi:polyphenol oxidase